MEVSLFMRLDIRTYSFHMFEFRNIIARYYATFVYQQLFIAPHKSQNLLNSVNGPRNINACHKRDDPLRTIE